MLHPAAVSIGVLVLARLLVTGALVALVALVMRRR